MALFIEFNTEWSLTGGQWSIMIMTSSSLNTWQVLPIRRQLLTDHPSTIPWTRNSKSWDWAHRQLGLAGCTCCITRVKNRPIWGVQFTLYGCKPIELCEATLQSKHLYICKSLFCLCVNHRPYIRKNDKRDPQNLSQAAQWPSVAWL